MGSNKYHPQAATLWTRPGPPRGLHLEERGVAPTASPFQGLQFWCVILSPVSCGNLPRSAGRVSHTWALSVALPEQDNQGVSLGPWWVTGHSERTELDPDQRGSA